VVGPRAFQELGATVVPYYNTPDGTNINDNCGSTHPQRLCELVKEHGADVGFAFDGDADRVIASDERGKMVDGDQMMALLAVYLKKKGKLPNNTLVATVMSNMGLDIAMQNQGINLIKTKVGDRYVLEKMLEKDLMLGGEQSGHVILRAFSTTGDGVLTALQVLSAMVYAKTTLSSLAGVMQVMPQSLFAAHVDDQKKYAFEENPRIQEMICELEQKYRGIGRLLIRASGTEPLVRVMIEGPDQREIDNDVFRMAKLIEKELA
jgi:phosphoglucosamine mutase